MKKNRIETAVFVVKPNPNRSALGSDVNEDLNLKAKAKAKA